LRLRSNRNGGCVEGWRIHTLAAVWRSQVERRLSKFVARRLLTLPAMRATTGSSRSLILGTGLIAIAAVICWPALSNWDVDALELTVHPGMIRLGEIVTLDNLL
jgi:hypothetical protein